MSKPKCEICDRTFKNEEALASHNSAVHSPKANTNQKKELSPSAKKFRNWTIFILILGGILLLVGWPLLSTVTAGSELQDFAQCLTESNVKMFGAYWCPNCLEQKRLFGQSWKKVDYIECSLPNKGGQTQECNNKGIQAYPTWELADGTKIQGIQSLQQLSSKSGCALPE